MRREVVGPLSYRRCRGEGGGRTDRSAIGRSGGRRCCRTRQPGLGGRGGSALSGVGEGEEEAEEEKGLGLYNWNPDPH